MVVRVSFKGLYGRVRLQRLYGRVNLSGGTKYGAVDSPGGPTTALWTVRGDHNFRGTVDGVTDQPVELGGWGILCS